MEERFLTPLFCLRGLSMLLPFSEGLYGQLSRQDKRLVHLMHVGSTCHLIQIMSSRDSNLTVVCRNDAQEELRSGNRLIVDEVPFGEIPGSVPMMH